MQLNIPTWFTLCRIILIPFFILFFYLSFYGSSFICVFIFIIAALTDFCDGYFARYLQKTTKFGAFLDPVADKIMMVAALILITEYYNIWWITLATVIIITREIIISSLREWMAEIGQRHYISVSGLGKFKTIVQIISIIGLLYKPTIQIQYIFIIILYLAVILTFISMLKYWFIFWSFIKNM